MQNAENMSFIRRVASVMCVVSMAVLVAACSRQPVTDTGEVSRIVISNVSSKTTQQLYSDLIGTAVYEQSGSYDSDGYKVDSANLRIQDHSKGYLIDVRSPDGSHFALLGGTGKDGVLRITKSGERTFTPTPPEGKQLIRNDIVEGIIETNKKASPTRGVTASPRVPVVIDVLAAYTRSAVDSGNVGPDINADARARLETVNLSIRNAGIETISLRLVKTLIYEPSPKISSETLANMNTWFGQAAGQSGADLIALFVGKDSHVSSGNSTIIGLAYVPGRYSISTVTNNTTFAHEIGHNVGGRHCEGDYPGYKNGYQQGVQCGDNEFWYSGLIGWVPGQHAKGNWLHADMARTWLEQKNHLASYAPPYPPQPEFYELAPERFTAIPGSRSIQFSWTPVPGAVKYKLIRRFALPPVVGVTADTNVLLEGLHQIIGTYSVEGVDANGNLSKRSEYKSALPLP